MRTPPVGGPWLQTRRLWYERLSQDPAFRLIGSEKAENTGFPGLGFCAQGEKPELRDRRRPPEERMQFAGSNDGDPVYTEWDRKLQDEDSGLDSSRRFDVSLSARPNGS